jgi:hypothetical protein
MPVIKSFASIARAQLLRSEDTKAKFRIRNRGAAAMERKFNTIVDAQSNRDKDRNEKSRQGWAGRIFKKHFSL